MKALLDEMISSAIAEALVATHEVDARAIAGSAEVGLSDRAVFELAQSEQRVLVTFNLRDFLPMLAQPHYGVVYVAPDLRGSSVQIAHGVAALLSNKKITIENAVISLSH